MAKKFYWLKMDKGYLSSPKVKKLRKIAGGDTYTIIYLKMQLLSIESGGVIEYRGIEPTLEEELALILDEDEDNVKITVSYLVSQGLLVSVDGNTFLLPDAAERIGTESESKERVRACRERKAIRESIPLEMVKKLSGEQILLPDGNTKFIDNKRYGGNAEYVYELAECRCEICGESDTKKLVIHHNNGYSNDLDDLYLLCHSCHKRVECGSLKCENHRRKIVTCNTIVTACNTEKEKEKDKDKDKDKELDRCRKRPTRNFVPPSLQEVEEYARSRSSSVDPKRFWEYFDAGGWKDVKGQPVRSWKQKFITWESKQPGPAPERRSEQVGTSANADGGHTFKGFKARSALDDTD